MFTISDLKQIADALLLRGSFCQDVSLFYGKTGMCLFLFLYARRTGNPWYEDFAGRLLDDVCSHLSSSLPVSFADGLCGIGWSIEFLKQEGFIEGDTDEILSEIDAKVMERDVRRISDPSFEYGIGGIAAYVHCRQNSLRKKPHTPFDTIFKDELKKSCERLSVDDSSDFLELNIVWQRILDSFSEMSTPENINWQQGLILLERSKTSAPTTLLTNNAFNDGQYSYEERLTHSPRKSLFIFSESAIGAEYGVGTYIKQLVKCFSFSEWDVHIVTLLARRDEVSWIQKDGIDYFEIPLLHEMRYVDFQSYTEKYNQGAFYYLSAQVALGTSVYCHFNFFGYDGLAALCKEKWQAKIYFTVHYVDWAFDLLGNEEWLLKILSNPCGMKDENVIRRFRVEQEFMIQCCDCVIAVASHSYSMLRGMYAIPEEKLMLVPNALEDTYKACTKEERQTLRTKYGFSEREKIILFVGRIEVLKGVLELIEAFKLLRKEVPNIRLVIVGNGNFAKCLDISNPDWIQISFTGFLGQEQLSELYAVADIGVVPSYYEQFGYVALEMMMNMLPILVNDCAGLRELTDNGKYGTVFQIGKKQDVEDFKTVILQILQEGTDDNRLFASRDWALKNYSIPIFQERIREMYYCGDKPKGI